ncbi:hypothetical protein [Pseudoruegeria sp. HB172150]|uniref:hypothetical protein n=1 Tax=Pseudoruegeria sp. HB172150 TaxID=2721164 RepID=UPI00155472C6|nr:hypothetical protein [Pseudoruegeria sp. HB172150]
MRGSFLSLPALCTAAIFGSLAVSAPARAAGSHGNDVYCYEVEGIPGTDIICDFIDDNLKAECNSTDPNNKGQVCKNVHKARLNLSAFRIAPGATGSASAGTRPRSHRPHQTFALTRLKSMT